MKVSSELTQDRRAWGSFTMVMSTQPVLGECRHKYKYKQVSSELEEAIHYNKYFVDVLKWHSCQLFTK